MSSDARCIIDIANDRIMSSRCWLTYNSSTCIWDWVTDFLKRNIAPVTITASDVRCMIWLADAKWYYLYLRSITGSRYNSCCWSWSIILGQVHTNLGVHTRQYTVALFLKTVGDEALKVYNGFKFPNENTVTVADIIAKFDTFAVGEVNETYERFIFNQRRQHEGH